MSDLQSLIERVEKATGPDREIDALLCATLRDFSESEHYKLVVTRPLSAFSDWMVDCVLAPSGKVRSIVPPAYTDSIDAALSLVARAFPGWRVLTEHGDNYSRVYFRRGWGAREETLGVATTERSDDEIALCLIEALLRAVSHVPAQNEATEETR